MIGERYWSTGITVWCVGRDQWAARAKFFDNGFCDAMSSEGEIRARYVGPLSLVIDVVRADAERLGITWNPVRGAAPSLYYRGDGEHTDILPPPLDWRRRLSAEARRLGWSEVYAGPEAT